MRGHEPLLDLRMRGKKPTYGVEIETDEQPSRWVSQWASGPYVPSKAHVHIAPSDTLRRLDFRFVIGLHVAVDGPSRDRVEAVFEACKKAGAQRVIATVYRQAGDAFHTVEMLDTEGVLTWHE